MAPRGARRSCLVCTGAGMQPDSSGLGGDETAVNPDTATLDIYNAVDMINIYKVIYRYLHCYRHTVSGLGGDETKIV